MPSAMTIVEGDLFGRNRRLVFSLAMVIACACSATLPAQRYTTEHPDVVLAIDKGLAYLEKNGATETRTGGIALAALALVKNGAPENHHIVRQAVAKIRSCIKSSREFEFDHPIYSASLSAMLICELDPHLYQQELAALNFYIQNTQRWDGSWSYMTGNNVNSHPSGDMSMTQNALMAAWSLHHCGHPVSAGMLNRAANFLILAQDNQGQFPYQTTIAQSSGTVSHQGPSLSMTAAGMSGVYICRNMFDLDAGARAANIPSNPAMIQAKPAVFKKIETEEDRRRRTASADALRGTFSKTRFDQVTRAGNDWLERNYRGTGQSSGWWHYYLYALERYETFRDLAEGASDDSPDWYNWVAYHLITTQKPDGSWSSSSGAVPDTAFSVLVLCRSTRKSVEQHIADPVAGGMMRGGRGLPTSADGDDIVLRDGRIVSLSELQSSQSLLERIDELNAIDEETLLQLARMPARSLQSFLTTDRIQNARVWLNDANVEVRLAAVDLLAKSGDVKNAPALIAALSDPEYAVVEAAHEALKRISRNAKTPRLTAPDSRNASSQLETVRKNWQEWYRALDLSYDPYSL
ncbi:MAG: HEAT repeat domain-containing protein [Planctomycetaceae bacterium]|nr:HEAT repeat domain-containing protein [Planctomycetaceae bacterium]